MSGHHILRRVGAPIAGAALLGSLLALSGAAGIAPAGALGVVNVSTTGSDTPTCGDVGFECRTITHGVARVDAGGLVQVAAGTYNERVLITKALTINGAGEGNTIVEGNGSVGLPNLAGPGQIRIQAGNVSIEELTVRTPGSHQAIDAVPPRNHYGIHVRADVPGAQVSIENVTVEGNGPGGRDYGIYCEAAAPSADFVLEDSTLVNSDLNPLLIERCSGNVTVQRNYIEKTAGTAASSAVFVMNHSGTVSAGDHSISNNVIVGSSISYNGAFTGGTVGQFGDVRIFGNTLTTPGTGISVANRSTVAGGENGTFQSVSITGNTLTGSGVGNGISISGKVDGVEIGDDVFGGNTITGYATGIATARVMSGGEAPVLLHVPTGTTAVANRIVGNAAGAVAGPDTALAAENNWWGCNAGPASAECDSVTSAVDANPWLQLGISASPTTVAVNQASAVTADILRNSDGALAPGFFPRHTPVAFSTSLGTVSPTTDEFESRVAGTSFSSATPGTATVQANLDGQVVSTTIVVSPPPAPPGPKCILIKITINLGLLGLKPITICI